MIDTQIVKDNLVCTILLLLHGNKYGAHLATVNALRENDPHSFRRYLQMSSEVYQVRIVTCSEYN